MTAKSQSAPCVNLLMPHLVPKSSVAPARTAISIISVTLLSPTLNPAFYSIAPSSNFSAFARTLFSGFENYTTKPPYFIDFSNNFAKCKAGFI